MAILAKTRTKREPSSSSVRPRLVALRPPKGNSAPINPKTKLPQLPRPQRRMERHKLAQHACLARGRKVSAASLLRLKALSPLWFQAVETFLPAELTWQGVAGQASTHACKACGSRVHLLAAGPFGSFQATLGEGLSLFAEGEFKSDQCCRIFLDANNLHQLIIPGDCGCLEQRTFRRGLLSGFLLSPFLNGREFYVVLFCS